MKFGLKDVKGTATNRLKAWNIYDVVLRSVSYEKGTSKNGKDCLINLELRCKKHHDKIHQKNF